MRTSSRLATLAASVVVAGSLAACAQQPRYPEYQSQQPTQVYNNAPVANNQYGTEFGTVSNIETLQSKPRTSGAGAVLGAVVGGVLGNQIGGGSGRAAATVIGAVGGGVAGNAIEGRGGSGGVEGYRLVINLDQGGQRVYEVASPGDLRTGDRVRLNGGQISRQ
ncbi:MULTISPECIES: glycine zipper 2TM domain-containing protein [unclassified Acidovorax]|uniref:glycine zipper 2TM domain-containing protein n=1 Tax=unclassified Acidovorax TaxID=2684926 RepID=UPI002882D6CC|nr:MULTISPECIES: glycine zipper 2TM domain-containing protein [unclassified Acidovorax]